MIKIVSFLCVTATIVGFSSFNSTQSSRLHDKWLQERYFEAVAVKEGMTRADLLKKFRIDGGLQLLLPTRYVLRSSNMIKVDVEFQIPEGLKGTVIPEDLRYEVDSPAYDSEGKPVLRERYQFVANEKLKIKNISRPYIEQFNYD